MHWKSVRGPRLCHLTLQFGSRSMESLQVLPTWHYINQRAASVGISPSPAPTTVIAWVLPTSVNPTTPTTTVTSPLTQGGRLWTKTQAQKRPLSLTFTPPLAFFSWTPHSEGSGTPPTPKCDIWLLLPLLLLLVVGRGQRRRDHHQSKTMFQVV